MLSTNAELPTGPARLPKAVSRIEHFPRGAANRPELEAFIADSFRASYGAEVNHFSEVLLGARDKDGHWIAALGYTPAKLAPLFLEHYLDAPVEAAISAHARSPVDRASIVEVGNLAAHHPGAARSLIVSTTQLLNSLGLRWVVFTATVSLLNSFSRLHLQPHVLAPADPARLPDGGQRWGSYYDTQPKVMFGDIHYGYTQLA
ncbi:thermostable hemolysin [Pseudoduganella sp. OTU4001]|uniref:thermostable hemolysin n=1 Tax=Pseudoduganella sp. OTU4001 TaxID=3043854 RepID=UPI00313CB7F9